MCTFPIKEQKTPKVWFPTIKTGTGTEKFTIRLVELLNKRGIRAEITWLPLKAEYLPHLYKKIKAPSWANLIHINSWMPNKFSEYDLPIVTTIHSSAHDPKLDQYKDILKKIYHDYYIRKIEITNIKKSKFVFCVSNHVKNIALENLYNMDYKVIYNGVNTKIFHPIDKKNKKNQEIRLLYAGAWKSMKGINSLPKIINELGENFYLSYTGPSRNDATTLKMPKNTQNLGFLKHEDVIKNLQNSDALILLSKTEGLPLIALEAMSCGIPVIGSSIEPLKEIISIDNGYLSNNEDEIISFLKSEHKNLENLGKQARKKIINEFNIDKMVDNYIYYYFEALK